MWYQLYLIAQWLPNLLTYRTESRDAIASKNIENTFKSNTNNLSQFVTYKIPLSHIVYQQLIENRHEDNSDSRVVFSTYINIFLTFTNHLGSSLW